MGPQPDFQNPSFLRSMWKRTIIANLVGVAILLTGWATNSELLFFAGCIVLVLSLGHRMATQFAARSSRSR
jgi:membrane protein implicated in regulation of membrane protease activity